MTAAADKKSVLDPWGATVVEDYNHLYEEFGINYVVWPIEGEQIAFTLSNNINYLRIAQLAIMYIPFVFASQLFHR